MAEELGTLQFANITFDVSESIPTSGDTKVFYKWKLSTIRVTIAQSSSFGQDMGYSVDVFCPDDYYKIHETSSFRDALEFAKEQINFLTNKFEEHLAATRKAEKGFKL